MAAPVLLIEVLPPLNEAQTRAPIWGDSTIPSVTEIVVPRTSTMPREVLRRAPGRNWPAAPEMVGAAGTLRRDSIGFATPLRDVYQTSGVGETG